MEHWYNIHLKQPGYLGDEDYQNYVLFNLFQYVDKIDVSLMNHPYNILSALFDSQEHAERFCRESGNFVQSISHAVDREMMTQRHPFVVIYPHDGISRHAILKKWCLRACRCKSCCGYCSK